MKPHVAESYTLIKFITAESKTRVKTIAVQNARIVSMHDYTKEFFMEHCKRIGGGYEKDFTTHCTPNVLYIIENGRLSERSDGVVIAIDNEDALAFETWLCGSKYQKSKLLL